MITSPFDSSLRDTHGDLHVLVISPSYIFMLGWIAWNSADLDKRRYGGFEKLKIRPQSDAADEPGVLGTVAHVDRSDDEGTRQS